MFLREHLEREECRLSPFWQERELLNVLQLHVELFVEEICHVLFCKERQKVSGKEMNVRTLSVLSLVA